MMAHRVLFVCLGNICRSPTAESVFRQLAEQAGLDVLVDSAGTADWHVGKAPYAPAQRAAKARGYDLSCLRARRFRDLDFAGFDLIIGMDDRNVEDMERLRPSGCATPVRLFLDYAPETGFIYVPDPYYTRDFNETLDLIETASRGLIAQLAQ